MARESLAVAALALVALLILEVGLDRVGAVTVPAGVAIVTAGAAFGAVVAAAASWALELGARASIVVLLSAAALVLATGWHNATQSPLALVVAAVAATAVAVAVMATVLASFGRTAMWLIDRRRTKRGELPMEDALLERLSELAPSVRRVIFYLAVPATLFLGVTLFIDPGPAVEPGILGAITETLAGVLTIMQALAVSVLGGAIVTVFESPTFGPSESAASPEEARPSGGPQTPTASDTR